MTWNEFLLSLSNREQELIKDALFNHLWNHRDNTMLIRSNHEFGAILLDEIVSIEETGNEESSHYKELNNILDRYLTVHKVNQIYQEKGEL